MFRGRCPPGGPRSAARPAFRLFNRRRFDDDGGPLAVTRREGGRVVNERNLGEKPPENPLHGGPSRFGINDGAAESEQPYCRGPLNNLSGLAEQRDAEASARVAVTSLVSPEDVNEW